MESISCASDISVNKASGDPWAATEGVINMQKRQEQEERAEHRSKRAQRFPESTIHSNSSSTPSIITRVITVKHPP